LTYKDAAGQTTTYSYNSAGQLIAVKDALNQITDYAYDNLGYLTQITNANDKTEQSLAYDTVGRVTSRTDSEGYTLSYSYDDFDRVTQVNYPDGTVQTASWDKLDLASITDRQGRTTQYSYDAVRNLIASIDPLNRKIQYGYYPNQNLKNLIDANGQITTWNRDLQSRVTAKVYADGHQESNGYETTTSRLKTLTDSLGQSKRYTYAKDNRPTKLEYLNAINATPTVSFSYDPWFPRVTSMTDGTGTTQYQYQALGTPGALNLKQTDGPYLNDTIAYQYDALGRISQRSVDSSSESFDYDALSRVLTHTNPLGSFTHTYLGETGQLTSLQHSNGRVSTHWSYDDNAHDRHLLGIQNSGATRSYDYETSTENLISQIHKISTGNRARPSKDWSYGYDLVDRLETVQASDGAHYSYEYDAGDNLTAIVSPTSTTDFTINSLNQVADANGVAYTYDANGNLIDTGTRTYHWDADNRLLQINYKSQPSRNTQFRYDGLGRRVAIISKNGTMTTENRYLWCGDNLCQSRMATDVVNWRSYPQGEVRPLGNTLLYFSRDHLGSVRDVLTVQAGVRIATYDYDAYGKPTYDVGRISTNFRYAGMFYLEEAGLYLTQYRVYDPNTGRWLSRDPIGEMGGVNLYGYVGGNPVNNTDSSGLFIDTIADAGFILYDLYKLANEGGCEQNTNLTALGLDIVGAISPGVTGLGAASRVTNTVSRNPIIIGENMKRVTEYADKIGGHAYKPIKNDPFNFALGMKRNENWIKAQIKNGREIIDIGPDFQRRAVTGRSSQFYEMERRNLNGYYNYKRAFERNNNQTGVPGLDF
jgi:RHS repeat-associated protein